MGKPDDDLVADAVGLPRHFYANFTVAQVSQERCSVWCPRLWA